MKMPAVVLIGSLVYQVGNYKFRINNILKSKDNMFERVIDMLIVLPIYLVGDRLTCAGESCCRHNQERLMTESLNCKLSSQNQTTNKSSNQAINQHMAYKNEY